MKITQPQVIQLLNQEYPFLKSSNISVLKQFIANNESLSNSFLITSSHPKFKLFVAKGHGHKSYGMENEFQVLKLFKNININTPKLLLPDHKPENLLLIEYIESQNAEAILKSNQNIDSLFYKIGQLIGNLHTTKVDHNGPYCIQNTQTWFEFQKEKLSEAVLSLKPVFESNLFLEISDLVQHQIPILERDTHSTILIHRDTYINNFILDKNDNLYLIDFAMASGGKPLYELAKFYVLDLYNHPEQVNNFLKGYTEFQTLQKNFKELMKLYILRESLGIIKFAHQQKDENFKQIGIRILKELINNNGRILDLISNE